MKLKTDKIFEIVLVLVLIGLVFWAVRIYTHLPKSVGSSESVKEEDELVVEKSIEPKEFQEEEPKEIIIPETLNLEVPFICQAPLGDWGSPFKDACEEAVVLMIHYYFFTPSFSKAGQGKLIEPKAAAKEIKDLVEFETKLFGFYESITAEQTAQLIRDYYGYKAEVIYDISEEDIKKELVKGNPVIVPAAGRMLKNPYFTPPGPLYHMLVIKGYAADDFIVNDAGTKRGADYTYSYSVLEKSIHDWNNGDVENGRRVMITVWK